MKNEKKVSKKKNTNDKNLENQIATLEDNLKRALADYQNLERRILNEKSDLIKYSNQELLKTLLPSFDNLYLAEKYIQDEGIKLTVQKLTENLREVGVKRIEVENKKFDPSTMECIEVVDGQENMVVQELRPGFMLFDKVIRPAQVKVGNAVSIKY